VSEWSLSRFLLLLLSFSATCLWFLLLCRLYGQICPQAFSPIGAPQVVDRYLSAHRRELCSTQSYITMDWQEQQDRYLKVTVQKCQGLIGVDRSGTSDPYVKLRATGGEWDKTWVVKKVSDVVEGC
jgi:hypothetical protein